MNLLEMKHKLEQMKRAFQAMEKTLLLLVEQVNKQSEVINGLQNQITILRAVKADKQNESLFAVDNAVAKQKAR